MENAVFLRDMPFQLSVGTDAWHREGKVQPVNISLSVHKVEALVEAATSDDVRNSLDYGQLYKTVLRRLDSNTDHQSPQNIALQVLQSVSASNVVSRVEVALPKAALRAEGGLVYICEQSSDPAVEMISESFDIRGIKCACIIGVNPHERKEKQMVIVHLNVRRGSEIVLGPPASWRPQCLVGRSAYVQRDEIINTIVKRVEESSYRTLEALADVICRDVTMDHSISEVGVSTEKPYAIPGIGAAGVRLRRRRSFYEKPNTSEEDAKM